jgi:predicted Zn-dependent protease
MPLRLQLLTLGQGTTLDAMLRGRAAAVSIGTLALINQVQSSTPLAAGQIEKWVTGQAAQ